MRKRLAKNTGSAASRQILDFNWSETSLGPIDEWPVSLRTVVESMLSSRFPQAVVWGPALITIHNDAFLPILGEKPPAIGRSFSDVWAEAWPQIRPLVEEAYRGQSTFIENFPLTIDRHGYLEKAYFTFCYSALRDDDGNIAGMLDTVIETTDTVSGAQKLRTSEERFRAFTTATSDVIYQMSADWKEMRQLDGRGFLADTEQPSIAWQDEYLVESDLPQIQAAIDRAIAEKSVFVLEHRVLQADGKVGWTLSRAVPVLNDSGEIVEWFGAATDITERKLAEQQQSVINREMSHRLKNTLAMVQAIAMQTLRPIAEREPVVALEKRIQALSSAHDILFDKYWHTAPIRSLISATLQKIVPSERLDTDGPDLSIGPKGALSLSLVLHELATNAVKYGALSNDTGRILLEWKVNQHNDDDIFTLKWAEKGGPRVEAAPSRTGFGSKLVKMGLIGTGGVEMSYAPSGFKVVMTAGLSQIQHTE